MKRILEIFSSIIIFAALASAISVFLIYDTVFNKGESVVRSPVFVALAIGLFINILSCVISRISGKTRFPVYFYLVHWGILIIIAGFVLSSFYAFQGDILLLKGQESNIAQGVDGVYKLPFRIRLDSFSIEYYLTPEPEIYVSGDKNPFPVVSGKSISVGNKLCRIEKFLPDFVLNEKNEAFSRTAFFNNPAVRISCVSGKKTESYWIFASIGGHGGASPFLLKIKNGEVKNFISAFTILYRGKEYRGATSVNSPFSFEGYKIYQTSYEPSMGEASLLTVKKDKWVWLVLFGFAVLAAGAVVWLF
ncbi:MAG: hypothetical protein Fur0012_05050 [Elusimicrobiota bacterium]